MNIALIGATGFVGSAILPELLSRGHRITALARTPSKIKPHAALTVVQADVLDPAQVASAVAGHDAVISAYNPGWSEPDIHDLHLRASDAIVEGVKTAGVKRLLAVGGAGSLYVAPGLQLVDTPQFPPAYKQGALAAREALNRLQRETRLDWSFVSPPIALAPGARTGEYRTGTNELLTGQGDQPAGISVADLAVAIVDEIEHPQHVQKRFTVAH
ncbi:MAG: NAD(P)-dependent oxidoreductase [Polaromonas sp.]|uniref:NAD(P)-dependent oxidoreductase n=1 Tax=Polaromonas sp. TaxID=1869339 RepID=UPI00184BFAB3|nr:NAD(P)-dependent oxidoreductase [Polaromonas sp.]MBA3594633.1 NAD(P)-dependent oxidoreductase [Polaromonas sp.]